MIKYFTIEDLLKHYLQKKFHILLRTASHVLHGRIKGCRRTLRTAIALSFTVIKKYL